MSITLRRLVLFVSLVLFWPVGQGSAQDPASVGQWGAVKQWPVFAIHATLQRTGKVLFWRGRERNPTRTETYQWDPVTDAVTGPYTVQTSDLYCGGHGTLADGRTIGIGGQSVTAPFGGIRNTNIFDPTTLTWTPVASMAFERWYPTSTTLRNGRVLAMSGQYVCGGMQVYCVVQVPEIYDVASNSWTTLTSAVLRPELYPFMFLLPNGKVYYAGPVTFTPAGARDLTTYTLDVNTQVWTAQDASDIEAISAAMYRPGKILKSGGGSAPWAPADTRAQVIDMTVASPTWRDVGPMAIQRSDHNLVLLPDGKTLAVGGTRGYHVQTDPIELSTAAVMEAELWDPTPETWTTMAPMSQPRGYHSTALLLPDGRVLSAGGEAVFTAQVYSPPYLFKGPRPTITSVPASAIYTLNFSVSTPDAASISSVVLMRPGSLTHGFDMNQRYVSLSFTAGSGTLTVNSPASRDIAPPGYYMLFLVNNMGIPSTASFMQIDGPDNCG